MNGLTLGTGSITYTIGTGINACPVYSTVTVNSSPTAIGGPGAVCAGFTSTFTDATSGGTWSSLHTSIATLDASSGIATGISSGTDSVAYTLSATGCASFTVLTVNPLPVISGSSTVCTGSVTTLSSSIGGGTWSATNGNATIDASSGAVTGISSGVDTITCTLATGCSSSVTITINPTPVIFGNTMVCVGATITLTSSIAGGAWTSVSSNATVDRGAGVVTGISADTVTIVYLLSTGCFATTLVTVNPEPTISGSSVVCVGSTITLTPSISGGAWSSNDTTIATVTVSGTNGIVLGISPGTSTISYELTSTGCGITVNINDNSPGPIIGTKYVCSGLTTTLSNETGGGSWISSDATIATVGISSGIVTGIATGASIPETVTITYTTGCTPDVTAVLTIDPMPVLSGLEKVCVGYTTTLSTSISGGTWTNHSPGIVAIDAASGIDTGVSPGIDTIAYTLVTGCPVIVAVTVNSNPVPVKDTSLVCVGSTTTFTDATPGGTWSSVNTSIATIDASSGVVTGISAGIDTFQYLLATGCSTSAYITVNVAPAAVSGLSAICLYDSTTYTDTTSGGVWSSSDPYLAYIDSFSGVVTGYYNDIAIISYTISNGCSATAIISVNPLPDIFGTESVCVGGSALLASLDSGGIWTSVSATATVDSFTGIVTGVTADTVTILYTLPTGCFSSAIVNVNANPDPITGTFSVCTGSTTILFTGDTTGGTWSSLNMTIAGVDDLSGVVNGLAAGTDSIEYVLTTGCFAIAVVTVNPNPAEIAGSLSVCLGSADTLADSTPGGVWTSFNTSIVSIDTSTGVANGISGGMDTVAYTLSTGCSATAVLTVSPYAIVGFLSICVGTSTTLADYTTAGTWSTSNSAIASIDTSLGIVTGVTAGVDTVVYTIISTGCSTMAIITVNANPDPITGVFSVCVGSAIILFTADTTAVIWSSVNPSIADIDPFSGVVTGVSSGTDTVSYVLLSTGCMTTAVVTVNPNPRPITGSLNVCLSGTDTLIDSTGGGVWSSFSLIATIDTSSGALVGMSPGTETITYSLSTGCYSTATITVAPGPITGYPSVCSGSTTTLSNIISGGTWSSANPSIADIGSSSGVVTAASTGIDTISYTLSTGCFSITVVTVNPVPVTYGTDSVYVDSATTFTGSISGGTWSSSNTAIAVIGMSTGIVTGVDIGIDTVTYVLPTGCLTTTTFNVFPYAGSTVGPGCNCGTSILISPAVQYGCSGYEYYPEIIGSSSYVIETYTWTPSSEVTNHTGPWSSIGSSWMLVPTTCATYTLAVTSINNSNLIVNGDLGTGATDETEPLGFNTDYDDDGTTAIYLGNFCDFTTDPSLYVGVGLPGFTDHSTPHGNMMIFNGSDDTTKRALYGTMSLCCNTNYVFSFYYADWNPTTGGDPSPPDLHVFINGICYNLAFGVIASGIWHQCTIPFHLPSCGGTGTQNVIFKITDANTVAFGNDFALDDISLTSPSSCVTTAVLTLCPFQPIEGDTQVCVGKQITLTDVSTGGTWSSNNTAIATVDVTGVVTGVAAGVVTIDYTTGDCIKTHTITVNPTPFFGLEPLTDPICSGIPFTLIAFPSTGCPGCSYFWSGGGAYPLMYGFTTTPTNTVSGGVPFGGSYTYSLIEANIYGCSSSRTFTVTPDESPEASISGPEILCQGDTYTFTGTPTSDEPGAANWTLSGPIASISSTSTTDILQGTGCGLATITYTVPSLHCGTAHAITDLTVYPTPAAIISSTPPATGTPLSVINCGSVTLTGYSPSELCPGIYLSFDFYTWTPTAYVTSATPPATITVNPPVNTTYTLTVTNEGGCHSFATITVETVAPSCVCNMGVPFIELGASGVIAPGTYTGGHYVINNNVNVPGNVILQNCIVVMASGVSVTVAPSAKLTLDGSHLFCCHPQMWKGIILEGGPSGTGRIKLIDNALIEDAKVAISVSNPFVIIGYTTTGYATDQLIIYSSGAIFNKDSIGIRISNTNYVLPPIGINNLHPSYPFVIENTVFTCRNFYTYSSTSATPAWPFDWPPTYGTNGLKKPWDPTAAADGPLFAYSPPYNIDNPAASAFTGAYAFTTLNDGLPAAIGIDLENVGNTGSSGSSAPGSEIYSGMYIGSNPALVGFGGMNYKTQLNMYDFLVYGIFANNSNLVVRNSTYIHMRNAASTLGIGIHTRSIAGNKNRLWVYGEPFPPPFSFAANNINTFYDDLTGVEAIGTYNVKSSYAYVFSNHTITSSFSGDYKGWYGFNIQTPSFYEVQLNHNTMYNITDGINMQVTMPASGSGAPLHGQIYIDTNVVSASITGVAPALGEFVNQAINVQATTGSTGSVTPATGETVNIDDNNLKYVYNGIYAANFNSEYNAVTSDRNNVQLTQYADLHFTCAGCAATTAPQTGIRHDNITAQGYIYYDTVTGPGYNIPTPPSVTGGVYALPIVEGVHVGADAREYVTCNNVNDINSGFFYGGLGGLSSGTSTTMWGHNFMWHNNYGFVLDGAIGPQPGYPFLTIADEWQPSGWWTGATGRYGTYTVGFSYPTASPLTVNNILANQIPPNNSADVFSSIYAAPLSINENTNANILCEPPPYSSIPISYGFMPIRAARQQIPSLAHTVNKNWIAQMGVWIAMMGDSTMDSSSALHSFRLMAENSRFKYLTDIEDSLVTGNYSWAAAALTNIGIDSLANTGNDSATGVILADTIGADEVVQNYRNYYSLVIDYNTTGLTASDTATLVALANSCPYVFGSVIYEARALYTLVFNQVHQFSDLGCDSDIVILDRKAKSINRQNQPVTLQQQYTLYPNPNDGQITLTQLQPNIQPVTIEILNSIGISVYKSTITFAGGIANLNLSNFVPGLYLMKISEPKGGNWNIKFVVE